MNKYKFILVAAFFICLIPFISNQSFGEEKSNELAGKNTGPKQDVPYKIGSGDVLEIVTWKEADFSRPEVLVRIDGMISFPLLGDIQAAGKTPIEVKQDIEKKLKHYIANPVVTVTVLRPESQKFYVLGEVAHTGEYNLLKDLTVLQAFALAGGFTQWASKKEIILLRQEATGERKMTINYKNIIKGKDLSQNIKLRANDTIIVP